MKTIRIFMIGSPTADRGALEAALEFGFDPEGAAHGEWRDRMVLCVATLVGVGVIVYTQLIAK